MAVPDKGKIAAGGVMQIMQKLGRGPQAPSNVLSNELKSDKPDWNVVQARATDISKLATDLAKLDPPRGSKELWQKNNTDFLEAAGAIGRAAQDQNLDSAKASRTRWQLLAPSATTITKRKAKARDSCRFALVGLARHAEPTIGDCAANEAAKFYGGKGAEPRTQRSGVSGWLVQPLTPLRCVLTPLSPQ